MSESPTDPGLSPDRQGIQVIARAASVLRALEHQPEGMTLAELARAVDLPRSTVQRIVDALHEEGLVIAASVLSGVRLGPALLALAAATRFHIAQEARSTLVALARASEETVDLSIPDEARMVFIDQIAGRHRLAAVSAVGVHFSMHCSANGKAALAAMSDAEIERLRKRLNLSAETPHTITRWDRLLAEIQSIRQAGIAFDREENSIGICAVAAAVRAPSGEIAAISIPVPTQRFRAGEQRLCALLQGQIGTLRERLAR